MKVLARRARTFIQISGATYLRSPPHNLTHKHLPRDSGRPHTYVDYVKVNHFVDWCFRHARDLGLPFRTEIESEKKKNPDFMQGSAHEPTLFNSWNCRCRNYLVTKYHLFLRHLSLSVPSQTYLITAPLHPDQ